jgi:hypothetical protein
MRRLVLLAALLAAAPPAAHAQMPAEAIGRPLPKADLPAGTVTVRVIAGDFAKPVETEVRLGSKVARTDASGRATFTGVAPGSRVSAAVDGPEGEVKSEEFAMPAEGGVALLLSTVPFAAGAGPMAGPGGRPAPRMMASQPRVEQNDPRGRVTVRLTYNDLDTTEGVTDHPVVMVAYAADDRIAAKVVRTDGSGRAVADNLDATGSTAYYALSLLPRDSGHERLMSLPISPGHEGGIRLMLSGEKLDSGLPLVDDLAKFVRQPALPAGQVIVAIGGELPDKGEVELLDVVTGEVVAKAPIGRGRAVPGSVTGTWQEPVLADTAPGTVEVEVVVAAGGRRLGLPRARVLVRQVGAPAGATPWESAGTTDADGKVTIEGAPADADLEAVVDVQGTMLQQPFRLPKGKSAKLPLETSFELLSLAEAAFEGVPASPEGAYLCQTRIGGTLYRSPPFQMAPERGVVVPLFILERLQMTFQLDARFEDDYFSVRGNFTLQNAAWAPYAGPSEGLRIPAPKGATGLGVADMDKAWVAVDGTSFRLLRPVPPLGGDFRAGFSIPVEDGKLVWDMPLPHGSAQSSLAILQTPKMKVNLPPSVRGEPVPQPDGSTWFAIRSIDIRPNMRMIFDVTGLPERPAWQEVSKLGAGIAVILLLVAGVLFGVLRKGAVPAAGAALTRKQRKQRIDELLDQVASIDRAPGRSGDGDGRRAKLVAELERLYREESGS